MAIEHTRTTTAMRRMLLTALSCTAACVFSIAHAEDSAEPIRLVTNNWGSQLVVSHVTGTLLEDMGYAVEYHPADTRQQFARLGSGDLHVQMEVWQGTMEAAFAEQMSRERITDAGTYTIVTREDWWYPEYMEALCPGLPNWAALNDCAEALSTDDTTPQGQFLAGPADWGRPDRERIEALNLKFQIVHVDNRMNLWGALEHAWQREAPIVLLNWTPNWTEMAYPGKFVEFPNRDPAGVCEEDPAWGESLNLTHDCGSPRTGWLKKVTWSGFADQWACAAELINAIDFNNEQLAGAAALTEVDEMSPETAALRWIDENSAIVDAWRPVCANTLELTEAKTAAIDEPVQESAAEDAVDMATAEAMATSSGCLGCHAIDGKLVGPSLKEVSAKYRDQAEAQALLVGTVLEGGVGNWGEIPMPANAVSEADAHVLVNWVLAQ